MLKTLQLTVTVEVSIKEPQDRGDVLAEMEGVRNLVEEKLKSLTHDRIYDLRIEEVGNVKMTEKRRAKN